MLHAVRRPLIAAALVAALVGSAAAHAAAPTGAAPTVQRVLSVAPGFDAGDLPAGATVRRSFPRVGALLVSVPADRAAALAAVPGVRGVSPDVTLQATSDTASTGGGLYAPRTLGGAAGTSGAGAGVTVALVDTGVADTALLNRASGRLIDGVDTSGSTGGLRDGYGHGTFLAGLIAGGTAPGSSEVVGIAPAARVVDVKVAGSDGTTSLSRVLDGLDWVVGNKAQHGIGVLSLSLAAGRPQEGYGRDPLTDAADAVQAAGITVVVAAGNDPTQVGNPAQNPALFAVGAADLRGVDPVVAPFSGRGNVFRTYRPDVVAGGVSMLSVLPADSALAKANPQAATGTGLHRGSGTSQATAVTSGAVAIFLQQQGSVAPLDVRASFARAAKNLPKQGDGSGLLRLPDRVHSNASLNRSGTDGSVTTEPTENSWSATSWSATSWSATSWSATSWSANSWSATSWSAAGWPKAVR
jgi:serine protease AprX